MVLFNCLHVDALFNIYIFTYWIVFQNCTIYAENVNELSFEALKVSDSAIYAYVITNVHNGQYYNISGKTRLIVDDHAKKVKGKVVMGNVKVHVVCLWWVFFVIVFSKLNNNKKQEELQFLLS